LTAVGEKNWIVVTRDERIRYNVAEKQAMRRAKVRAFMLAAQNFLRRLRGFGESWKNRARLLSQRLHAVATLLSSISDCMGEGASLKASPGSDRVSKIKPRKTNKRKAESERRSFIWLL
jgi:hypothetical protein